MSLLLNEVQGSIFSFPSGSIFHRSAWYLLRVILNWESQSYEVLLYARLRRMVQIVYLWF